MNCLQWLLGFVLMALIFVDTQADSESGSNESVSNESVSNESGSNERKHHKKHKYTPPPSSYPNNYPAYLPQGPPTPYYYSPPMPYYNSYPPSPAAYGNNPYPYGGYYNQPSEHLPQFTQPDPLQGQGQTSQGPPEIPGSTSTINHSLKVNKEYKEDGHHYRPDGTLNNLI